MHLVIIWQIALLKADWRRDRTHARIVSPRQTICKAVISFNQATRRFNKNRAIEAALGRFILFYFMPELLQKKKKSTSDLHLNHLGFLIIHTAFHFRRIWEDFLHKQGMGWKRLKTWSKSNENLLYFLFCFHAADIIYILYHSFLDVCLIVVPFCPIKLRL